MELCRVCDAEIPDDTDFDLCDECGEEAWEILATVMEQIVARMKAARNN